MTTGHIISSNARARGQPDTPVTGDQQGRGTGIRSMVTKDKDGPGTSTPCQKPMVANRHECSSDVNSATSLGLGRSDCVKIFHGVRPRTTSTAACVARRLSVNSADARALGCVRSPQPSRPSQLRNWPPWVGRVRRAIEQRLVLPRRTPHVDLVVDQAKAQAARRDAAGWWRWRGRP